MPTVRRQRETFCFTSAETNSGLGVPCRLFVRLAARPFRVERVCSTPRVFGIFSRAEAKSQLSPSFTLQRGTLRASLPPRGIDGVFFWRPKRSGTDVASESSPSICEIPRRLSEADVSRCGAPLDWAN